MHKKEKLIILKNAFANVARGGANAIVTIVLPPVLTRTMTAEAYGAWALVLQLSAYVGYFDFGLQSAVGRFVAHCNESRDHDHRDSIVSTSAMALFVAGIFAFIGLATVAFHFPEILHKMTSALRSEARIALLMVSGSLALGLPASVLHGIFVGLQKNEISAYIIGGSRLLGASLLVTAALEGKGLTVMAAVLAAVNLASYAVTYLAVRKAAPNVRFVAKLISFSAVKELFAYCYSLSVWSLAMLLVTGLDLMFVAFFDYPAVPYYAVAAGLVTFLAGLQNAVFNAMMPAAAVLHARGDSRSLGRMLVQSSRYGMFLLIFTGLPLMLFASQILQVWVGRQYALEGAKYLVVLLLANIVRLFMTPYAVTLIGTGQQRLVILSPLVEGLTNLIGSVGLGYCMGAMGIAYGTLVGAVIGVVLNIFYNMPRTTDIKIGIPEYLRDALLRPTIFTVPLLAGVFLIKVADLSAFFNIFIALTVSLISVVIFWFHGLCSEERTRLLGLFKVTPSTG